MPSAVVLNVAALVLPHSALLALKGLLTRRNVRIIFLLKINFPLEKDIRDAI
jgi:hypothetical protein